MPQFASPPFRAALVAGLFAILPAASTLAIAPAAAHEFKSGSLTLDHPWTRATPNGAEMAGGFVTVVNAGEHADKLVGGSFELSERTEVHEMKMEGDVMKMRQLDGGLDIPAGATVELKPGSYHLMFMKLTAPLEAGTKVKGTLLFEKAGEIPVEFAVEAISAKAKDHKAGGHDAMPMDGAGMKHGG
ncbi:copper chaperone PCu(A)C [Pleomorphomonas sp. NRK KF1]|uniref:copper chaperone PCu(A)C n=1 Tax=Pleomorphomonas sp. NRK KF1 TaxID=2943000 RepID=UPI0020434391|nr:copper chaperone PCu(A)C [Pleomorphomonas sp. NRK KF1]MCM5552626.1 copper chaperone PCu(A)C [Pleomorphomonas sp. NRK KF1]